MPSQRDPEGVIIRQLNEFAELADARVLDIGCGDGRLTRQIVRTAAQVVGIDPKSNVWESTGDSAIVIEGPVSCARGRAEELPFPPEKFDVAMLGWTL
jgi:ubiquinone/menaquinone biosynthesis C-methylase UbiE